MSKVLTIALAGVFAFSFASTAVADTGKVVSGMGHKLTRGIVNASTGWVELFKEIHREGQKNPFLGITVGPVKGSAKTAIRMTAGGIETATFLFPVPKDYEEPLIHPKYAF